ncbi:uncharacterized protein LOC115678342 [Syzygium oleosum]|uniref:uncharacterized protein LOC115678342 n=1 Tax=Syzygium oleosum TaxID=219896 RepID=UPI0011D1938D|nr:uncharacterized protein LOC115678342 [Syzygium oleosum]
MGGWLACFLKPKVIQSRDVPPKQVENRGQRVKKPSKSEDFWSTSTFDMDHSAVQSQGSMSSISTSQTLNAHGGTSSGGTPEFVNHGLLLWHQTRQQWIGNKKDEIRPKQVLEPRLSWNATYDSLLGSNKRFAQRVPLAEMVDFLVDIWEQEGMYD